MVDTHKTLFTKQQIIYVSQKTDLYVPDISERYFVLKSNAIIVTLIKGMLSIPLCLISC